jgi:hypothetical protein
MSITFDHVFKSWVENELEPSNERDILALAKSKGFGSISEWRLTTALRLGLDKKEWVVKKFNDPNTELPKMIIGPYKGWSQFFDNQIKTSFEEALEIPEFFSWCQSHNRIPNIAKHFPTPTTLILFETTSGRYIHIEGGHRICAAAYAKKIKTPIKFTLNSVQAFVTTISDKEIDNLKKFLDRGTNKQ